MPRRYSYLGSLSEVTQPRGARGPNTGRRQSTEQGAWHSMGGCGGGVWAVTLKLRSRWCARRSPVGLVETLEQAPENGGAAGPWTTL